MDAAAGDDDGLLLVWEFVVAPGRRDEFLRAYGRAGPWATLFARAEGYQDTLLSEDRARPGRFLTLDVWETAAAWRLFRERFAGEYAELDAACASLTERETPIGEFRIPRT
jgi:heme-degrading monooxygenase HmoA